MSDTEHQHDPEVETALEAAAAGDREPFGRLLDKYRGRIRRMIQLRMDPRLAGRADASDIVQEAFLEAAERAVEFRRERDLPFVAWIRFLAGQKILQYERRHLGAQKRDVRRELRLGDRSVPGVTSAVFASALLHRGDSPSNVVARGEEHDRLERAFDDMPEVDREILALRHFEHLSNAEAAQVLGIGSNAASARYVRAMKKLAEIMKAR